MTTGQSRSAQLTGNFGSALQGGVAQHDEADAHPVPPYAQLPLDISPRISSCRQLMYFSENLHHRSGCFRQLLLIGPVFRTGASQALAPRCISSAAFTAKVSRNFGVQQAARRLSPRPFHRKSGSDRAAEACGWN